MDFKLDVLRHELIIMPNNGKRSFSVVLTYDEISAFEKTDEVIQRNICEQLYNMRFVNDIDFINEKHEMIMRGEQL